MKYAMEFLRGTTPTIEVKVKNTTDLSQVTSIWVYISQNKKVLVDKLIEDVTFDYENNIFSCKLTQEDTLALKAGDAEFQFRVHMSDDSALGIIALPVKIYEVYKGGVIQ